MCSLNTFSFQLHEKLYFNIHSIVPQVDGPEDVEYNGHGFRSAVSTTGTFQRSFTTPGTYYYIAGGFSDIGMLISQPGLDSGMYVNMLLYIDKN